MQRRIGLIVFALAIVGIVTGCSSKPMGAPHQPSASVPRSGLFIPVTNPVRELCTDDTLSRTEWFNHPVATFHADSVELNGRPGSLDDLAAWASKYYEHKVERALWVQIAPDGTQLAERATNRLNEKLPDLQVRQVEFGFTCPKLK